MESEAEAKSINNIYYDCLEHIYDYLDIEDLLNIARTCKRQQAAAAAYFGEKFGQKWVCLTHRQYKPFEYEVIVHPKNCLPFLRCFGSKISQLVVQTDFVDGKMDIVERYVSQYCADTLESISFDCHLDYSKPQRLFQKPFKTVANIHVRFFEFQDQLPNFVNWFPNVRYFEMYMVFFDESAIEVNFPHLEKLRITNTHYVSVSPGNVAKLLRANPQLQTVDIGYDYEQIPFDQISNMVSVHSSLSKLWFSTDVWNDVDKADLMRFASEHPTIIKLRLRNYSLAADDVVTFLGQLNFIKKFSFCLKDHTEFDRLLNQLGNEWQHNFDDQYRYRNVKLSR